MRVQLEVLHAPIVQDDELNILPANVYDHMRIFVELERGFGVRNGFNQRHVGLQHILQDVLRVPGRAHSQHFHSGILRFDLLAQVFEHVDRVLDGIAVRKLIRLAEDVAILIQENCLCGGRAAINPHKASDS